MPKNHIVIAGEYTGPRDDGGHHISDGRCVRNLYPLGRDVLNGQEVGSQVTLTLALGDGSQGSIFLIDGQQYQQRGGVCL